MTRAGRSVYVCPDQLSPPNGTGTLPGVDPPSFRADNVPPSNRVKVPVPRGG
jgi:hypothetical protein